MGRKSIKENKTIYQLARESMGLTREAAEGKCPGLTAERIAKIEGEKTSVQPEDVKLMAECYQSPALRLHYCAHECVLGKERMPDIQSKELAQIAIETLNSLNKLNREKDRLLEIVEDGTVRPDEREDFLAIKTVMDKIALSVHTMQLWVDEAIANGKLPKDFLTD